MAGTLVSFVVIDDLYFHRDRGKNLERSRELLESWLEREPENPAVLWRLSRSLVRLGEREEEKSSRIAMYSRAERAAERSVSLDPREAEAYYWYGVSLGRHGQARGLLRSLFMIKPIKRRMRRVLELDPEHGRAHHVLGELYGRLPRFMGGSKRRAAAELEAALRLSPDYTAIHPALARTYLDLGREGEARGVLRRLLEVENPDDPAEFPDNVRDGKRMLLDLE